MPPKHTRIRPQGPVLPPPSQKPILAGWRQRGSPGPNPDTWGLGRGSTGPRAQSWHAVTGIDLIPAEWRQHRALGPDPVQVEMVHSLIPARQRQHKAPMLPLPCQNRVQGSLHCPCLVGIGPLTPCALGLDSRPDPG